MSDPPIRNAAVESPRTFFAVYLNCCAKRCEQEQHKDAVTHASCISSEGLAGNKAVCNLFSASTAEGS